MTYEERLGWCFKVYDLDDSGFIDREELTAIVMDINYTIRRCILLAPMGPTAQRDPVSRCLPPDYYSLPRRSYKSAKSMISKLNHKYEVEFGERLEKIDPPQFKYLAASHGTLLIYPALGVMERVIGLAFEDPDSHLDWMDCMRPGQSGMVLQKHLAAQAQDDDLELG